MTDSLLAFYDELFFHSSHPRDNNNQGEKYVVISDRVWGVLSFPVCFPIYLNAFVFKGYNPRVSKEHRKAG